MRKIISLLCLLCLLLCSCGFGRKIEWDVDSIESINIVELGEWNEENFRYEITVLCEISNCSEFVDRLNELEQHKIIYGQPRVLHKGATAIQINYLNGDFDLVACLVQSTYRSGEYNYRQVTFDSEQFSGLIEEVKTNNGFVPSK